MWWLLYYYDTLLDTTITDWREAVRADWHWRPVSDPWIPPTQKTTTVMRMKGTDATAMMEWCVTHRSQGQRAKGKGHRKRASGTWCCVFIHVYMYVPGQNPFLFHALSIENVCPSNMESQWLTFFGHWILQNCWRSNVF